MWCWKGMEKIIWGQSCEVSSGNACSKKEGNTIIK